MEILSCSEPRRKRTSGFLETFCDHFLGLITQSVGNAFPPKWQQSLLQVGRGLMILPSGGPQVGRRQSRLVLCHAGFVFLLNVVWPSLGLLPLSSHLLTLRLLSKIHAKERQGDRDRRGPVLSLCRAVPFYLGRDPPLGFVHPSRGPGLQPTARWSGSRVAVADGGQGRGAVRMAFVEPVSSRSTRNGLNLCWKLQV